MRPARAGLRSRRLAGAQNRRNAAAGRRDCESPRTPAEPSRPSRSALRGRAAGNPGPAQEPHADRPHRADRRRLAAHPRTASRCRDLDGPLVQRESPLLRGAARIPAAHLRPQPAVPLPHRRGDREARPADRARAAADGRERLQPDGLFARACLGAVAVHPRHRPALRARAELVVRRPARHRRVDQRRARLPAPRSTRCTATGTSRSPPTTGAKARWRARSGRTAPRACRPTTRASSCRRRRATTSPSSRR